MLFLVAFASVQDSHGAESPAVPAHSRFEVTPSVLFGELNCSACHALDARQSEWVVRKSAPDLKDAGGRLNTAWLRQFIAAPSQTAPGTTMPDLLNGVTDAERQRIADALTHFIVSIKTGEFRQSPRDSAAISRGEILYHSIGCVACHVPQKASFTDEELNDPLAHLAQKYSVESLKQFLIDPLASRPSGRMPSLRLTDGEAFDLAQYLLRENKNQDTPSFQLDSTKAAQGREYFSQYNCSACHNLAGIPATQAAPLRNIASGGCLAEAPTSGIPNFHLSMQQRKSLTSALSELNESNLQPPTAKSKLEHTMMALNCFACHVRGNIGGVSKERNVFFTSNVEDTGDEGRLPPRLDDTGDKLQPSWIATVLKGDGNVRPYLNTRMPSFGTANINTIPDLFVAIDRHPQPIAEPTDEPAVRRNAGRELTGTHGYSCIACHRFNRMPAQALQIIDLTSIPTRLNQDWFERFMRDPNHFHPGTRMPSFWPDGVSVAQKVLDGDAARQIAALWTYFEDGAHAKIPDGLGRQSMEIVVGSDANVYRGKLWEAGFRALAVGYPEHANLAFDAEEMRLSLLWRGRFLDASAHWSIQGMGQIHPLGTEVVVFPHGTALAILSDPKQAWPTEKGRANGLKFGGYKLDGLKRPILMYSFNNAQISDYFCVTNRDGKTLRRTLTFSGASVENLYFRIAAGKIAPSTENVWKLENLMSVHIQGNASAMLRTVEDKQELIAPIHFENNNATLEIDYAW